MALLDNLLNQATRALKSKAVQEINSATNKASEKLSAALSEKREKFTFQTLPQSLEELKALKEAKLQTPYETAALAIVALCLFEKNQEASFECIEFLNGPNDVNAYTRQFISEHLKNKKYLPLSFFAGATPKNGYTPSAPYEITVFSNSYSFQEENWATIYVVSGGADNPRSIKLRKKPSTGEWFINEMQIFTDIRVPEEQDPWA